MELPLPVPRHATGWTRHRLVERMVLGRHELRAFEGFFGDIVPEPVLAWFEAAYHGVADAPGVPSCVLAWRLVAAANVATPRTAPQVKPPPLRCEALDTAGAAGWYCRVDAVIHD